MRFVLDTSALLTGRPFDGELYATPDVLRELRRHGSSTEIEALVALKVRVVSPGPAALAAVQVEADRTGDRARLSPTDTETLAVALELDATILTDDYAIQNLAARLGVAYRPVMTPGIREVILWRYRCKGCGRVFAALRNPCPVCGAPVRTVRPPKD